MTLNIGEYGFIVRVNLGVDVSSSTDLKVFLQPQIGEIKEFSGVVGTSDIDVGDSQFLENEYLEYTLLEGDVDETGLWRARGSALVSNVLVKSDYSLFTVLP